MKRTKISYRTRLLLFPKIFIAGFLLFCLLVPLIAQKTAQVDPEALVQSKDSAQSPLYAKYYDQVLALEKAGKPAAALAAIPKVYEAEIPVDAFYQTLDKKNVHYCKFSLIVQNRNLLLKLIISISWPCF